MISASQRWSRSCWRRSGSPIALKTQLGDIKLGDLNGDKIPDLVVTHSKRDCVDIFFGNGQGGFRLAPGSPITVSAESEFTLAVSIS